MEPIKKLIKQQLSIIEDANREIDGMLEHKMFDVVDNSIEQLKREMLAALAHQQWSGWMEYLFANSFHDQDGTVIIPKWAVERWTRQMNTEYEDLPGDEKRYTTDSSESTTTDKVIDCLHTWATLIDNLPEA